MKGNPKGSGFLRRQATTVVGKASPHVYACLIIGFFMLLVNSFHLYHMSKYKKDLQAIIDDEYPKSQVNLSRFNEDPTGSFNAEDELALRMKEAEVAEKFAKQRAEAQSGMKGEEVEEEPVMPQEARVEELGNLLFSDGKSYLEAGYFNPPSPLTSVEYKRLWLLQEFHDDFFLKNKHRRYIPRLAEPISKLQFHETFRQTSTPVIIPFDQLRHLGVVTKGWTLEQLKQRFPYKLPKSGKLPLAYGPRSGYKDGLDLGPALFALGQDMELAKGGGSRRNFPRNLMLKSKYLSMLEISRPPFVPRRRFQPPTLWMGTSTADTKLHSDCCDNFVMMIAGKKRWIIAPPFDSRHLRPIRCDGVHHSLCWASLKYPNKNPLPPKDKTKFDKLSNITIEIEAGEMLYLPAGWWHHIENLGPTIMVNFWTMGCENVAIALDKDPLRSDRTDFNKCPAIAQATAAFLQK